MAVNGNDKKILHFVRTVHYKKGRDEGTSKWTPSQKQGNKKKSRAYRCDYPNRVVHRMENEMQWLREHLDRVKKRNDYIEEQNKQLKNQVDELNKQLFMKYDEKAIQMYNAHHYIRENIKLQDLLTEVEQGTRDLLEKIDKIRNPIESSDSDENLEEDPEVEPEEEIFPSENSDE